MSNIATALKEEIARLVRKQLRSNTESLKKASSRYRSDIAAMKRRIDALEKQVASLEKTAQRQAAPAANEESTTNLRFKPQGMLAQRTRLGLSAREMGLLIGVSGQTIYHWEMGKTRPRPEQMANIAAVRKMGKREAKARLDQAVVAGQKPAYEQDDGALSDQQIERIRKAVPQGRVRQVRSSL